MFDSKKLAMEIANGEKEETGSLEFKSHLGTSNPQQYEVNQDGHSRYRIDAEKLTFKGIKELQQYFHFVNCIKPVCAFLNTEGGVLAIGFKDFLSDNGMREATGLINETEKDEDTFRKEVSDILESKFDRSVVNNCIKVFIERVGSKKVCLIKVDKNEGLDEVIFVEKFKVFGDSSKAETVFVRGGNSSRELTSPKDLVNHGFHVRGAKREQVSEKLSPKNDYIEQSQSVLPPPVDIEILESELRKINTPPFQQQKYIANAAKLLSVVKTKRGSKDCVEISLDDGSKRARMWDIDEVFTVCRKLIGLRVITEPRPQKHNEFEWFNNIYIDSAPNQIADKPALPPTKYSWEPKVRVLSVFECDYAGLVIVLEGAMAVWFDGNYDEAKRNFYKVASSFIGKDVHLSQIPSNQSSFQDTQPWVSHLDVINVDQLKPAVGQDLSASPRTFIKLEDIKGMDRCAPRTIKTYWDHPEGAYRITTKNDVFYSFRLPSRMMEKLRDFSEGGDASKNSINPFDKWEEKHVQHIKNITQDRGEKLGFDVITVQFEGLKIITIMDEDLFDPLSEQPLTTLPTEHPKI